jgi:hypothetical protein
MTNQANKHDNQDKSVPVGAMRFVVCTCGKRILVVPDVAAMSKALKRHLITHRGADEEYLIEQIFREASK